MKIRLRLLASGLAAATSIAASIGTAVAGGPSFDCAGARGPVETAICRSERLSMLDRRIDAAYRRVMRGWSSDVAMREEVREAQRRFLEQRSVAVELPDNGLVRHLEAQAALLEAIDTAPRAGFEGEWGNLAGGLRISREAAGLTLWGNLVEPILFRWICEVDDLAVVSDGRLVAPPEATSAGFPGWSMRLERIGSVVRVLEVGPPGTETAPDGRALDQTPKCGRRGRFDGIYFPTKDKRRAP